MTKVVFETATLADAVRKASRVAPSKSGHAFDKAAGIVLDLFPGEEVQAVIRATNVDVFSTEVVNVLDCLGDMVRWRLPSEVFASVIASLPITNGKTVTLEQEGSKLKITSGKTKATLILMDPTYYPGWEGFDPDGLTTVNGLGGRIEQVEWAASTAPQPPLCGVYLDGEYAVATDRYRIARTPCKIDLGRPVIIPARILGNVLRPMGEVGVAVRGSTLQIQVDDYHQIQTITYDMAYPKINQVMRTDHPERVEISKAPFLEMLSRANNFAGADRTPLLRMYLGREELAVMMTNDEIGLIGDVLEVPGQIPHPRIETKFTPKNLVDAVTKAPGSKVILAYDPSVPNRPFYVSDGSGYESWIVQRTDVRTEP